MDQRGAPSVYRGYRLQVLYTLSRILEPGDAARFVFQPEGKEDLAVWDTDGALREVIQVKSYPNLVLSHLSSNGVNSFLRRAAELLKHPDTPDIKLVSFGEIGSELRRAWNGFEPDRTRVTNKLIEDGFEVSDIQRIFRDVKLVVEDEAEKQGYILSLLRQHLVGIDPETAGDLLTNWLYLCAEQRTRITRAALIGEISDIGRFLTDRALYHSEWFTSITPLTDEVIPTQGDRFLRLKGEFAAGVQTRYEHILANLDLRRDAKLAEIAQAFEQNHVVIIHAASGQGKTTLAYRYLHDTYPESWRFNIESVRKAEDALRIAATLAGYANAVQIPMAVYVDVSPRDEEWPELVKRLARNPYLQILVTIREEDFARANLSGADFNFTEIPLTFDEAEARQIYTAAATMTPQVRFLDFEEAWDTFGGSGPLLEFVYLLTQTTTLRERLRQQVNRLRNEVRSGTDPGQVQLLRLVSVASAYSARLKVPEIISALPLPEPGCIFHMLEQEFLIRVSKDGQLVDGLHPVRSRILADLLTAPMDVIPWLVVASEALTLMLEEDIESFLLNACVDRPAERKDLSEVVQKKIEPETWCGLGGILRVFLWLGASDYIEANAALIEDAFKEFGTGWEFFLDLDLTDSASSSLDNWWRTLGDLIPPQRQAMIEHMREQQTSKEAALQLAMNWLSRMTRAPKPPVSTADWSSLAEICFWSGHWNVVPEVEHWLPEGELATAITTLPLDLVGNLSAALYTRNPKHHAEWLQAYRAILEARLTKERGVVWLTEEERTLVIHFMPLYSRSTNADIAEVPTRKSADPLHEETVELIGLIRRLFPDYEAYGSRGHGYRLGNLQSLLDDSTIKEGIPQHRLPLRWPTYPNSIAHGIGGNRFRPETWAEYVDQIIQTRELVLINFEHLVRGLVRYCQRRAPVDIIHGCLDSTQWDKCRSNLNSPPALPKCAVDPWGFASEFSTEQVLRIPELRDYVPRSLVLQKYGAFLGTQRSFIGDLYKFFFQAPHVMLANYVSTHRVARNRQALVK